MSDQGLCPLCRMDKIIQVSNPNNWICSNKNCKFHDWGFKQKLQDTCIALNSAVGSSYRPEDLVLMSMKNCNYPDTTIRFFIEKLPEPPKETKAANTRHAKYGNTFLK